MSRLTIRKLILPSCGLCHRANGRRYPSCSRPSWHIRPGSLLHGGPQPDALSIFYLPSLPMDHHHVDVFIFPGGRGTLQISGHCDTYYRCCHTSFGRLHRLSDSTSKDAPLVQMAYLVSSSIVFVLVRFCHYESCCTIR